ncbi:hypothetical protein BHE74_00009232 [Ensete ventricosum]|nr:hypothetical protein BHE74_00009232 [Ensete ventricosum]
MDERVVGSSPAAAGKGAAPAAPRHNLVRTFKYLMGSYCFAALCHTVPSFYYLHLVSKSGRLSTCMHAHRYSTVEKGIVFALSQASYGACLLLGYWAYFVFFCINRYDLFPFRFDILSQSSQRIVKLRSSLVEALKVVLLIGLVVLAFGPSYSYTLVRLLYGRKWSDGEAPAALRYYCFYVTTLAMNGM